MNLETIDLAPGYVTNDGGIAYLRQIDDIVYWFAEHPGRSYAHVFRGRRIGSTITGRFISVPKFTATANGRVTLSIIAGGHLRLQGQANGLPYSIMRPCNLSQLRAQLPLQTDGGFRSHGTDFDGTYQDDRGRRFYLRTVGDKVVFFAESRFQKGKRPVAAYFYFGTRIEASPRFSSGPMIALPKGQRRANGGFSMGFGDPKSISGRSDFQHLQNILAVPMAERMQVQLLGEPDARLRDVDIRGSLLTVEGDIVVGEMQSGLANASYALSVSSGAKLWPDCRVPYEIDASSLVVRPGDSDVVFSGSNAPNLSSAKIQTRQAIDAAIEYVNANTDFRWVPKTSADDDYVVFTGLEAPCDYEDTDRSQPVFCGRSKVGRAGGRQDILFTIPSQQARNFIGRGTFVHEMGHAMGLFHEHTRIDRDEYVQINWNGIRESAKPNFVKRTSNGLEIGPYDFRSNMHYGARTGGILSGNLRARTIIPRPEGQTIGSLPSGYTRGDIDALGAMCPDPVQQDTRSRRGDGGGIAITNLDNDPRMEVVLMTYDDANGQNSFKLDLCDYEETGNRLTCFEQLQLDGLGHRGNGAGIAFGDLDGFNSDDMLVAVYDGGNLIKYRICRDFADDRLGNCLSSRQAMGGQSLGSNIDGLGVAIGDIDGEGRDDVIIGVYDNPDGQNKIKYIIGRNPTSLGNFTWFGPFQEDGLSHRSDGFGATLFDSDNNGRPELMFAILDDSSGSDHFKTVTLYNLNTLGISDGTRLEQRFHAHSSSSDGAGIAAHQFGDGDPATPSINDGAPDLFLMSVDDPGNDDERNNRYKLRLIYSGAQ
ncbi:M12 family metallopeptidase [Roseibium denhamense]|uniref:M12 family metallopeptidase n=1 Tax=Roseibium denhamense TaxID=76305 RepID=UPI001AD94502|nr:M12 family metallopeptidase [Roseibium denhamense]